MSRSWAAGSTTQWRQTRARILAANQEANHGQCQLNLNTKPCPRHERKCTTPEGKPICTGTATQVHHTRGKAHGDDQRHLIAVCRPCNLHVGDPTRYNPQPTPRSTW